VPRLAQVEAQLGSGDSKLVVSIVQDASAVAGSAGKRADQLLLDELEAAQSAGQNEVYLCCVNRGILDDALIEAIDEGRDTSRKLLEAVTRAVSLSPDAPACWPLEGFPDVAVWPMDAESLLRPPTEGGEAPARSLLLKAIDADKWPDLGSCAAGALCPFCISRDRLSREREQTSLLQVLRYFEVSSGKRWSFRDLFSLVSYLLAGHRTSRAAANLDPCAWAAELVELDQTARQGGNPTKAHSAAIFQLVAAQYQHSLFHLWDSSVAPFLLKEIKELQLTDHNTAMGLYWFVQSRRAPYLPSMISGALEELASTLDPNLADPDTEVQVTGNTAFPLRELDVRFSQSITEGLEFARKYQVLSKPELDLLDRLAKLDRELALAGVRRRRPASATNLQRFVRRFASQLVRRSIGTRTAAVRDEGILREFQKVLEDQNGDDLYDVAQQVEQLLNNDHDFEISLTTTFGQPMPPQTRRALLIVPSRTVRPIELQSANRPAAPVSFLRVGEGRSSQPLALTYDLFKAVKELESGMSIASLPATVVALLDTARARLAGPIVRDALLLERARIRIGASGTQVVQRRSGFALRQEAGR
jgi:hypothetical protein